MMRIVQGSLSAATAGAASADPKQRAKKPRTTEIRRTCPTVLWAREAVRRTGVAEISCTFIVCLEVQSAQVGGLSIMSILPILSYVMSTGGFMLCGQRRAHAAPTTHSPAR